MNIKYVTGIKVKPRKQEKIKYTAYPRITDDVKILTNLDNIKELSKKYRYSEIDNTNSQIPAKSNFVLLGKVATIS